MSTLIAYDFDQAYLSSIEWAEKILEEFSQTNKNALLTLMAGNYDPEHGMAFAVKNFNEVMRASYMERIIQILMDYYATPGPASFEVKKALLEKAHQTTITPTQWVFQEVKRSWDTYFVSSGNHTKEEKVVKPCDHALGLLPFGFLPLMLRVNTDLGIYQRTFDRASRTSSEVTVLVDASSDREMESTPFSSASAKALLGSSSPQLLGERVIQSKLEQKMLAQKMVEEKISEAPASTDLASGPLVHLIDELRNDLKTYRRLAEYQASVWIQQHTKTQNHPLKSMLR